MQHLANEAIIYVYCLALMVFSGVLTKTDSSQAFGLILIALTVLLVCFNVTYIVFDLIVFIRLLLCRYGMILRQNLRLNRKKKTTRRVSKKTKIIKVTPQKPDVEVNEELH